MRLPQLWLSILSVNSIFLLNLGFPLLTLPTVLNRGEVIAQTDPNAEQLDQDVTPLSSQCEYNEAIPSEVLGENHPDYATLEASVIKLQRCLYSQIDSTWRSPVDEESVYVVKVNSQGEIIGYEPLSQVAKENIENTPLPELLKFDAVSTKHVFEFKVIFSISGLLEVQVLGIAEDIIAQTDPNEAIPSEVLGENHPDYATLEPSVIKLQRYLYSQIDSTWRSPVNEESVYVVKVNSQGEIIGYEPLSQVAKENIENTPLPELLKFDAVSTKHVFEFKVIFSISGLLEVQVLGIAEDIIAQTDPNVEAERLFNRGFELFRQGTVESYKQAVLVWEKALQLYREAGNLEGEAASLLGLGRIYDALGDSQQALNYYNQSLPLWRQVRNQRGEGITLGLIRSLGKNNSTDPNVEAERLYNQGVELFGQGTAESKKQAIVALEKALQLYQQARNLQGQAISLLGLGRIYSDLGNKQTALDYYNQSLPLWRQVGDKAGEATILSNIGAVYDALGDSQQALNYYNQSLSLRQQVGDKALEANTLNNIGLVYNALGDRQTALDYYNQSLPLSRQVGDKAGEANTLSNIGAVYDALGDKQIALDFYNQSLPLSRQVGNKALEAATLNNIGAVYDALGDKQQALDFYNQSLPLRRQVGDKEGEANTLNNIGGVYYTLGDSQRALNYFNQSLSLTRQVGIKAGVAATLNNIGSVYDDLGDSQQALEYYNQSLSLRRQVGNKAGEAVTLNNIGGVYNDLGDKQQALDFYNQSLPLSRQVGDKRQEATTLNNIGRVYDDLGDKQQALDYLNQSLPLTRQVGDKAGEAATLYNFALLKRNQGNLTEALIDMELAINIIEELRTKIISQDLRTTYFATVYGYYEFYIDLLMELHQQNPNQGYDAKALHASERGRARSLLDILAESGADIKKGVDPQLLAREKSLLQRLNALDQTRQLNPGERNIDELKQEIEAVRRELQNLEVEIKRNSPQYANLNYPEPLTASEIQQQVLDDETLLLVYSLGTERSFLWLVSTTEVKSYQLPKRSDIEALATSFLEEIQSLAVVPPSGEKLSQILLSPVINQLGNKRLVIVGDGILQTVPFAALPISSPVSSPVSRPLNPSAPKPPIMGASIDGGLGKMGDFEKMNSPQTLKTTSMTSNNLGIIEKFEKISSPQIWGARGAKLTSNEGEGSQKSDNSSLLLGGTEGGYKPLIVQHEIITLPSASSLAILREQVQGRTPAPKKVVVIADPVFEQNDPRFQIASSTKTETNDVNTIVLRQSLEDFLGKSFGRLQHTRQEAEAILALVPDNLERLALDFNANRKTATDSNLSQYQIVHFATHGLLNETQPELSGLVFSLYDEQGTEKAGFLQLSDIFNLTLSADLVVLSACQTGIGQDIRGEGLVSLTRGFMYAGAERVVVSLWAVADNSTSELMQNYYQKILETGSNPATAMREVQLEMLQSDHYNSPYFWAAFVFQGEWKTGLSHP